MKFALIVIGDGCVYLNRPFYIKVRHVIDHSNGESVTVTTILLSYATEACASYYYYFSTPKICPIIIR